MMLGVDFSARPADQAMAAALAAGGYRFACRYLSTPGNPKNLTAAEAVTLTNAGLAIVTVWETTAARALAGYNAGVDDGRHAAQELEAIGAPSDAVIFFAVDFDATGAQLDAVAGYAAGFRSGAAPHPIGGYGSHRVCTDLIHRPGLIAHAWQTAAWSYGVRTVGASLYQRIQQVTVNGVVCDVNEALVDDFGGWRLHEENDMTDDQARKLDEVHDMLTVLTKGAPAFGVEATPAAVSFTHRTVDAIAEHLGITGS